MEDFDIEECYNFVKPLILQCGEIVANAMKNVGKISTKSDFFDLVTEHDGKVERILIKGIQEKYPTHSFIGEEGSSEDKKIPELTDGPTWIIDPIDGTVNFCKKIPITCISVAFVLKKQVHIGIVYNPITKEFYQAKKGKGAFLNDEPIHVSDVTDMKRALISHEVSIAGWEHVRDKILERCREYVKECLGIRCLGSAALTLCYVACGQVEAFNVDDLWAWDIAAGSLIVQEAGGLVIHTNGGAYDIMDPQIIAACTQQICDKMLAIAREVDERLKKRKEENNI